MKGKTAEKYLYVTHLYGILIFFSFFSECLNFFFLKEAGEDEVTISVVKEL